MKKNVLGSVVAIGLFAAGTALAGGPIADHARPMAATVAAPKISAPRAPKMAILARLFGRKPSTGNGLTTALFKPFTGPYAPSTGKPTLAWFEATQRLHASNPELWPSPKQSLIDAVGGDNEEADRYLRLFAQQQATRRAEMPKTIVIPAAIHVKAQGAASTPAKPNGAPIHDTQSGAVGPKVSPTPARTAGNQIPEKLVIAGSKGNRTSM